MVGRTARPDNPGRAVSSGAFWVLAGLLWSLPAPAAAQATLLDGVVVSAQSGAPVMGATVRVVGGLEGRGTEARTDVQGRFRLPLPPGRYAVTVAGAGYETLRVDGVKAPAQRPWVVRLTPSELVHDPLVTAPDRARLERVGSGTASASVVGADAASEWNPFSHVDILEGLPGVNTAWTGLRSRRVAVRGLAPVLLEDDRPAQVASRGVNVFDFVSSALPDVDRVELLRGPQSVLFGPEATGGVVRVVTASPMDRPGTVVRLTAGQRELFQGAVREAIRLDDRSGLSLSGRYARGLEWPTAPPGEPATGSENIEVGSAQVRYDLRPWDEGDVVINAGVSSMVSSLLFLRDGPVQANDWRQGFALARVKRGGAWAQTFVHRADAGSSVELATGAPVVDRATVLGAQAQYVRSVHDLLDVTAGLDVTRIGMGTDGTRHGRWENDDGVLEAGAYAYGTATAAVGTEVVGALRVDHHSRFQGVQLSPRIALRVETGPHHTLHAAFNRGYTYPAPDLLFADRVKARIPILDTLDLAVRVTGLPDQDFTFQRRCPGGLDDRCMFSPLLPDVRLPATGAALWDAVLVPLALQDETLRSTLEGMGISPNGFAQIIGRPGTNDLRSRLVRWTDDGSGNLAEAASTPTQVDRLRPSTTRSLELGFRGAFGSRVAYAVDLHATRVSDLVGPLDVATPTLYLDGASVDAFLRQRMIAVGIPAGVAQRIAEDIAATAAGVPLGTLAPDQRDDSAVLLTYANLGAVDFWGADAGMSLRVAPRLTLTGALTYLSANCFDLDGSGVCGTAGDVTLMAPTVGASGSLGWSDLARGVALEGRVRYAGAFPVSVGAYQGEVPRHTLVDLYGRVLLPWAPGAAVSATVTNLLDSSYRGFVGTPDIGRLALVTLQYAF